MGEGTEPGGIAGRDVVSNWGGKRRVILDTQPRLREASSSRPLRCPSRLPPGTAACGNVV